MKSLKLIVALCLIIIPIALAGCGSSDVNSGTGTSVGPITGFGSVFVNGVEFSTTGTSITKEGNSSDESELRIGMVVTVHGSFDDSGRTGAASRIDYFDNLKGPIQNIDSGAQTILVMGQTVKVDAGTRFQSNVTGVPVAGLSDLQAGNVIEVSGLPQADGSILATYVELKSQSCTPGSEYEVKGTVSNLDASTFQINNLTVDYSNAVLPSGGLSNGMFVEVKTTDCYNGGVMIASKVERRDSDHFGDDGSHRELEGFITRYASATDFDVNGHPVSTTDSTRYEHGTAANLALNVRVEVEGTLDANGVLIARQISFENEDGSCMNGESSDSFDDHHSGLSCSDRS